MNRRGLLRAGQCARPPTGLCARRSGLCFGGKGARFRGRRTGLLAIPDRGLDVQGEAGAVILALLLLAGLDVCPVDLALLDGAHDGPTEPTKGLIFVTAAL